MAHLFRGLKDSGDIRNTQSIVTWKSSKVDKIKKKLLSTEVEKSNT